jgi:GT2 family glycosyltransferase
VTSGVDVSSLKSRSRRAGERGGIGGGGSMMVVMEVGEGGCCVLWLNEDKTA